MTESATRALDVEVIADNQRLSAVRLTPTGPRPSCRWVQVESTPAGRKVDVFIADNADTGAAYQKVDVVLPDGSRVEIRGSDFYWVSLRRTDGSYVGGLASDPAVES